MKPVMAEEQRSAASARVISKRRERLFYTAMAVVVVSIVFIGFARTYYLRTYFGALPLRPLLHLHGIVFTSWLVLFVTQTALVAANRTAVHRRLGMAGAVLCALMVIIGTATALLTTKPVAVPPGQPSPLSFLIIPLGDMVVFAGLVIAGFYYRQRVDVHKRLMLLATISILPPAIARLPIAFIEQNGPLAFFGLADLFIVICLIYDYRASGRLHRATIMGGLVVALSHPLRLMIGNTQLWLDFAAWLVHSVN